MGRKKTVSEINKRPPKRLGIWLNRYGLCLEYKRTRGFSSALPGVASTTKLHTYIQRKKKKINIYYIKYKLMPHSKRANKCVFAQNNNLKIKSVNAISEMMKHYLPDVFIS